MVGNSATFTPEELTKVLGHYDIGAIEKVQPFSAGNRRAPKVVVLAEAGKFILKRRKARSSADMARVKLAHSVQKRLKQAGFPVPGLIATAAKGSSGVRLGGLIYELFEFVRGSRYDGTLEETETAGRYLSEFHKLIADYKKPYIPGSCFHDSPGVRKHLNIVYEKGGNGQATLKDLSRQLMSIYDSSAQRVNQSGFNSRDRQVVHGDWHPGNLLFQDRALVAVVDFDSVRVAPAVTDLANAALQFSIVAGAGNVQQWPEHLDMNKLGEFVRGYQSNISLGRDCVRAIIDLMIETMIAEASMPVALTGAFGNVRADSFLAMIDRKVRWIDRHRDELVSHIES